VWGRSGGSRGEVHRAGYGWETSTRRPPSRIEVSLAVPCMTLAVALQPAASALIVAALSSFLIFALPYVVRGPALSTTGRPGLGPWPRRSGSAHQ
jgi:hypothetical protein